MYVCCYVYMMFYPVHGGKIYENRPTDSNWILLHKENISHRRQLKNKNLCVLRSLSAKGLCWNAVPLRPPSFLACLLGVCTVHCAGTCVGSLRESGHAQSLNTDLQDPPPNSSNSVELSLLCTFFWGVWDDNTAIKRRWIHQQTFFKTHRFRIVFYMFVFLAPPSLSHSNFGNLHGSHPPPPPSHHCCCWQIWQVRIYQKLTQELSNRTPADARGGGGLGFTSYHLVTNRRESLPRLRSLPLEIIIRAGQILLQEKALTWNSPKTSRSQLYERVANTFSQFSPVFIGFVSPGFTTVNKWLIFNCSVHTLEEVFGLSN